MLLADWFFIIFKIQFWKSKIIFKYKFIGSDPSQMSNPYLQTATLPQYGGGGMTNTSSLISNSALASSG